MIIEISKDNLIALGYELDDIISNGGLEGEYSTKADAIAELSDKDREGMVEYILASFEATALPE